MNISEYEYICQKIFEYPNIRYSLSFAPGPNYYCVLFEPIYIVHVEEEKIKVLLSSPSDTVQDSVIRFFRLNLMSSNSL